MRPDDVAIDDDEEGDRRSCDEGDDGSEPTPSVQPFVSPARGRVSY